MAVGLLARLHIRFARILMAVMSSSGCEWLLQVAQEYPEWAIRSMALLEAGVRWAGQAGWEQYHRA